MLSKQVSLEKEKLILYCKVPQCFFSKSKGSPTHFQPQIIKFSFYQNSINQILWCDSEKLRRLNA